MNYDANANVVAIHCKGYTQILILNDFIQFLHLPQNMDMMLNECVFLRNLSAVLLIVGSQG